MIQLNSPLEIEPDPQGGWQLTFWAGNPFDHTTPFRMILAEIAKQLGHKPQVDLLLPPHEEGEDFVEGTLRLGEVQLRVYFEHSLGYLALMNENEATLRDVAARLSSTIATPTVTR